MLIATFFGPVDELSQGLYLLLADTNQGDRGKVVTGCELCLKLGHQRRETINSWEGVL